MESSGVIHKEITLSMEEKLLLSLSVVTLVALATLVLILTAHLPPLEFPHFVIPIEAVYLLSAALLLIALLGLILRVSTSIPERPLGIVDEKINPAFVTPENIRNNLIPQVNPGPSPPPPIARTLVAEDPKAMSAQLDTSAGLELNSLYIPPDPEVIVKSHALSQKGAQWLADLIAKASDIDWRQFAMMNNTFLIRDTFFDKGHSSLSCIQAYLSYLNHLFIEDAFFLSVEEKLMVGELVSHLEDAQTLISLVPCFLVDSSVNLSSEASKVMNMLNSRLQQRGVVYLPIAYCGRETGGHALLCKLVLDTTRNEITLFIFNLGEGVDHHLHLNPTATHQKVVSCYYPAVFSVELWEKNGCALIHHLLRFLLEMPPEKQEYSSSQIYDLLACLSSFSPNIIIKDPLLFEANPQNIGDCTEKSVRNLIVNYLRTEKKISSQQISQLFLKIHLAALVSALKSHRTTPTAPQKRLLGNGCKAFGTVLIRCKDCLPESLYLEFAELVNLIRQETKSTRFLYPFTPPLSGKPPSVFFPKIDPPEPLLLDQVEKEVKELCPLPGKQETLLVFEQTRFAADLKYILSLFDKHDKTQSSDSRSQLYEVAWEHYLFSVPIPKWNDPLDPWNQLDISTLPTILNDLQLFFKRYVAPPKSRQLFSEEILQLLTLYTLIDKLSRRMDTKGLLKKYSTPFPIEFFEPLLYFSYGTEEARYQAIKRYFSENTAATGGVTFPPSLSKIELLDKVPLPGLIERYVRNEDFSVLISTSAYMVVFMQSPTALSYVWSWSFFDYTKIVSCTSWEAFLEKVNQGRGKDRCFETRERSQRIISEFFWMHQGQTVNAIFSNSLNVLNTPSSAPESKKENSFSNPLRREVLRLVNQPELRIGMLLQWLPANWACLKDRFVRRAIELCLFSPGLLEARIKERPETIEQLRELIEQGILYCLGDRAHTRRYLPGFFFLLHCGVALETHWASLAHTSLDQKYIEKYYSFLKKGAAIAEIELPPPVHEGKKTRNKWRQLRQLQTYYRSFAMHLIWIESFREKKTLEEWVTIYGRLFQFKGFCGALHVEEDWVGLTHLSEETYCRLFEQLKIFLGVQKGMHHTLLNELCNRILHFLVEGLEGKWSWQFDGSYSYCWSQEHRLDFLNGKIRHKKTGNSLICLTDHERKSYKCSHWDFKESSVWTASFFRETQRLSAQMYGLLSFDRSTCLVHTIDSCAGICLLEKGKESGSLAYFSFKSQAEIYFLNRAFYYSLIPQKDKKRPKVICWDSKKRIAFMQLDFSSQGVVATRVNEKAEILPYKLINPKTLAPINPYYLFLLNFINCNRMLCFVHETTEEIEEIILDELQLSFKRREEGLECVEHPGFFWRPLEIAALKEHSSSALILQNQEGQLKVLLVHPRKEKKALGDRDESDKEFKTINYMLFELPSVETPHFSCQTASETLFLVYFFRKQRDIKAAYAQFQALPRMLFDCHALGFVSDCFKLTDHTPLSLAFTMKVLLFCADNFHRLHGYAGSHHSSSDKEKFKLKLHEVLWKGASLYCDYLRASGDDEVNEIPISWRLSEEEELRILSNFAREGFSTRQHWPRLLVIREQLLRERIALVSSENQEISLIPKPLQKILLPSQWQQLNSSLKFIQSLVPKNNRTVARIAPNYVPRYYTAWHFIDLYEQIRRIPLHTPVDPFDFTLVALMRSADEVVDRECASLLVYVRYFPRFFEKISFKGKKTTDAKEVVFRKIVEKAYWLEKKGYLSALKDQFEKRGFINLNTTTTLALPAKAPLDARPLLTVAPLKIDKIPFLACRQLLFKKYTLTTLPPSQLFDKTLLKSEQSQEKLLIEHFEEIHHSISTGKVTYELNEEDLEAKLTQTQVSLESVLNEYDKEKAALEEKILNSVNDPFKSFSGRFSLLEEKEFQLRKDSGQIRSITLQMLMHMLLENTADLFYKERAMLKQVHIETITRAVHYYMHLQVLSMLSKEAIALVQKLKANPKQPHIVQELLEILNYEFLYEPEKYPEIAYMKIKTGKLPRKEQWEVYKWVCEGLDKGENRLFQLPAGGGKTAYLTPLLILRCKSKPGWFSCVIAPESMYQIDTANLDHTLKLLGYELDTIDITMRTELDLYSLTLIHQQIIAAQQKRSTLIITPQTYYLLRLIYFIAAADKTDNRAALLLEILSLLEKHAILLGDESHRNLDPMTQAVYGVGNFTTLEKKERELLLELMKPLLGIETHICGNGKLLDACARLQESGQETLSPKKIRVIREELAQFIIPRFFSYVVLEEREALARFLSDKKAAMPPLTGVNSDQKLLIFLARYFCCSLIKKLLKLRTEFDHVVSSEQGYLDTPAYYKTPSHALFKDPYLTCVLTIKGTWHRGLSEAQFRLLLEGLQKQRHAEEKTMLNYTETHADRCFIRLFGEAFPEISLYRVDLTNPTLFEALFAYGKKNATVIVHYLNTLVLPFVGNSNDQLISTPAHLMTGFKLSVLFSATPLTREIYPVAVDAVALQEKFEVEVIAQSAKEENQQFIFPKHVDDFFSHLATHQSDYISVRHMIDAGGFLCSVENAKVAERWLEASQLDGVIYFKSRDSKKVGEGLCCRLKNPAQEIDFMRQEELMSALTRLNLKKEQLLLGVYFDAAHTESAHFDPEPNTTAFVFVGSSTSVSHLIQSVMRERGFLKEMGQRLIWVLKDQLRKKLQQERPFFTTSLIFSSCIINEVKARKAKIIMAGFHAIALKVEQLYISRYTSSLLAIENNPTAFKETVEVQRLFNSMQALQPTAEVLWSFAKNFYQRFSFPNSLEENRELSETIHQVIERVEKVTQEMVTDFQLSSGSAQVYQNCLVKTHQKQLQHEHNANPLSPVALVKQVSLSDPNYPHARQSFIAARQLFESPFLSEQFYIELNQINSVMCGKKELKQGLLKPIDFLLIVVYEEQVWAEAISQDLLPQYLKELRAGSDLPVKHQAFLIRADGVLYQEGRANLAVEKTKQEQILGSPWLKDVLIDVALLKGVWPSSPRFQERLSRWHGFVKFWTAILQAQPEPLSIEPFLRYLPERSSNPLLF